MSYAGDVTPAECWEKLSGDSAAIMVDVRTRAEWTFVGMPQLTETMKPLVGQEWQVFPQMAVDPQFVTVLTRRLVELGAGPETELCFLCRSGVRSLAAANAMASAGFKHAFNISGGFEGDPDENGHRGKRNGWKAEGLPWRQG